MFVNKIMNNRKRIEYTIAKYEEEQKAKLANAYVDSSKGVASASETSKTDTEEPASASALVLTKLSPAVHDQKSLKAAASWVVQPDPKYTYLTNQSP